MNRCAKCNREREERNLYNKMHGIYMGVCEKCWDGKFKLEEELKNE